MTHLFPQSPHCIQYKGQGGFLCYMLCSSLCYCSVPCCRTFNQTAAAWASRAPPHTKNMKCRVIIRSGEKENLKPNNVTIIVCTQPEAQAHFYVLALNL